MGSAQKPSQGNVVSAAHTPRTQQTWPPPGLGAVIATPPVSANRGHGLLPVAGHRLLERGPAHIVEDPIKL